MRITIRRQAAEGERYAPTAWDSQIGKTVPLRIGGGDHVMVADRVTIVAADVVDDGAAVVLKLDVVGPDISLTPGASELAIEVGSPVSGPFDDEEAATFVLHCYGQPFDKRPDLDLAKRMMERHIRICPQGAMPWADVIEWFETTDDGWMTASHGEWLDHWVVRSSRDAG